MVIQLMPLHGGDPVTLARSITLVGRKEGCDLRLNHKSVSKHHCVLVRSKEQVFLRDLGSTNGTRVNGKRVRRAALGANDQLHVAGLAFRVFVGNEAKVKPHRVEATQHLHAVPEDNQPPTHRTPHPDEPASSVVRVNDLPDAYSPVQDAKDD
jgi:pSer/pThr/pTyr-binding forkhead associated (FHA) protein